MSADLLRAEWLKLRTVRAAYVALGGALLAAVTGTLVVLAVVGAYDASAPAERAAFERADPMVVVMPFVSFFVGMLGGLAMTVEYGTRGITASLLAVPRRGALYAAKAVVVAATTLAAGTVLAVASTLAAGAILGDRPAPINPWTSVPDAVPSALAAGLAVMIAGLVALGLGAVTRSTAATVGLLGALTLVVPVFAHFLPSPWHVRLASVLLPNLAPQVVGGDSAYLLSPSAALAVLTAYAVLALAAGLVALTRRDA